MVVTILLIVVATGCGRSAPSIDPVQELPADVATIVVETWDVFTATFDTRLYCIESVRLALVGVVEDGDAAYLADDQLIIIEIPTSPPRFRESLVHELGHHLQHTCREVEILQSAFLAAQGFPPDAGWNEGAAWEEIPAEHFAEAVVHLVNRNRLLHEDLIPLADSAVQLVANWAASG